MVTNGRLAGPVTLDLAAAAMVADLYVYVEVRRSTAGVEERVAAFQTRIAATSSAAGGRDSQTVQGNAAQRLFVALAPLWAQVAKNDEVWSGAVRYRVLAVDSYPHKKQLLLQEIQ